MNCPECNVVMVEGIALKHESEVGARNICYQPIMYMRTPEIIKCLKCPVCGHSDDLRKLNEH